MIVVVASLVWANAFDDFLAGMHSTQQQWKAMPLMANSNLSARYDAASCVLDDALYMFGGELPDEDETLMGDLWRLNFTSLSWTQLITTGTVPPARKKHHLLCDEIRGIVYMVGGKKKRDCWAYHTATHAWSEIASVDDPNGWNIDTQGTDAIPMNTDDYIIVSGTKDGVTNDWKAYSKIDNSWAAYEDERVGVEDPGGVGVGKLAIMVGGSIPKGSQLPAKTYAVDTTKSPLEWVELVGDGFPGEEHRVVHLGDGVIAVLGDPSGKGPLADTNGIALLNTTPVANATKAWTVVTRDEPNWVTSTSEMMAVGYKGAMISLGGSTQAEEDGEIVETVASVMWVYNSRVCPHGCSGRGVCELGNCVQCQDSSGIGCEVLDPVPKDYTLIIILCTTLGGAFLVVLAAVVWRLTSKMREYRRMYNTSRLAEDMASQIAGMQLGELVYLQEIENPSSVQKSFQKIVTILECYRPYLPESLFDNVADLEPTYAMQAPGTLGSPLNPDNGDDCRQEGAVTIVFTDIVKSTQIWESCPEGMRTGLQIHNKVIRSCIAETGGYEVKTIGDSFMVAFSDVASACRFGVRAQEELHKADWPSSLADYVHCAEEGGWSGLRIRVGVHTGVATIELNNLTMRTDYFGNCVNVASRIEGSCIQGCVAVSEAVMKELRTEGMDAIGSPYEIPMPKTALKGVSGTTTLFLLLPMSLITRKNDVERHMLGSNAKDHSLTMLERRSGSSRRGTSVINSVHNPMKNVRHLNERLDKVQSATTACVEIGFAELQLEEWDSPITPVSNILSDVLLNLERTQGSFISFLNTSLTVGWNMSGGMPTHMLNATRFSELAKIAFDNSASDVKGTIGLCSGRLLNGRAGSSKQKFVTVIGDCVEACHVLARRAVEFHTYTLLAALRNQVALNTITDLVGLIRPVDRYGAGVDAPVVYELRKKSESSEELVDWAWSQDYCDAFHNRRLDLFTQATPCDTLRLVVAKLSLL